MSGKGEKAEKPERKRPDKIDLDFFMRKKIGKHALLNIA
jgi:hypothetical protein